MSLRNQLEKGKLHLVSSSSDDEDEREKEDVYSRPTNQKNGSLCSPQNAANGSGLIKEESTKLTASTSVRQNHHSTGSAMNNKASRFLFPSPMNDSFQTNDLLNSKFENPVWQASSDLDSQM